MRALPREGLVSNGVGQLLSMVSKALDKPLVVFFDEVDCLSDETLLTFLRQLRDGCISLEKGVDFPASIALIGMRNIRDYKARIRPERETLGSASPFNVITKAMTIRTFTLDEVRELYQQHTDATGQVFEPGCAEQAFAYSGGQPYLVNALAKWCVDEIHDRRYGETITLADIHEAKEKIIRERGTHLDSLLERMQEPRVRRIVEPVLLGEDRTFSRNDDDYRYVIDLGLLVEDPNGQLRPANPMYTETIGRCLTRDDQDDMRLSVPETPWVEVKLRKNFEKNRERAYDQVCRYMDHLGQSEGWLVVFDPDPSLGWDAKLSHEDIAHVGKIIHLFRC